MPESTEVPLKNFCKCCDGNDNSCHCPHHWFKARCLVKCFVAFCALVFVFVCGIAVGRVSSVMHQGFGEQKFGSRNQMFGGYDYKMNGRFMTQDRDFDTLMQQWLGGHHAEMRQYWQNIQPLQVAPSVAPSATPVPKK
jgi:hypothetical protein